ncbi:hypothetical protein RHECNPAF_14110054 [Rhizobium etli CNPAF512]|nr:hypothetical protein RHECNPAF_14110054 [Rhizobium etli CNPAF512]
MRHFQVAAIHRIGKDRLRMEGVNEIDALIVPTAAIKRLFVFVGAMEHDVARLRLQPDRLQQGAKRQARPFADRAPAFDAVVPGDLRARRHRLQLRERELRRLFDKPADVEPPGRELPAHPVEILRVIGHAGAVRAENRRQIGLGELTGERGVTKQEALRFHAEALGDLQHRFRPVAFDQSVAAAETHCRGGEGRADQEAAAGDQTAHHFSPCSMA